MPRPPQFAAGAQHTLYSGVELADHGLFYPFQWSPARPAGPLHRPTSTRRRRCGSGSDATAPARSRSTRTRAGRPSEPPPGTLVCGWQLHDRVVLQQWAIADRAPPHDSSASSDRPSPSTRCSGGTPRTRCSACAAACSARRAGSPTPPTLLLGEQPFDLAWLTFCAAHVAGHQFWDLSQLDPGRARRRGRRRSSARPSTTSTSAIDAAIGRVSRPCPTGTDVMVVSPVGMDVNTSRADMLPEMLRAILDPGPEATPRRSQPGSIWRLRAALPSGLRARVARALPERRRSNSPPGSSCAASTGRRTRAFAHPAENQGYVRLNLQGRERDGIVAPDGRRRAARRDRRRDCARSATSTGSPAVASVERVRRHLRAGARADLLPDLIVHWVDRPATRLEGRALRRGSAPSPSRRRQRAVGQPHRGRRLGPGGAGGVAPADAGRPARLEDVAATAAALGRRRHGRHGRRAPARAAASPSGAARRAPTAERWPAARAATSTPPPAPSAKPARTRPSVEAGGGRAAAGRRRRRKPAPLARSAPAGARTGQRQVGGGAAPAAGSWTIAHAPLGEPRAPVPVLAGGQRGTLVEGQPPVQLGPHGEVAGRGEADRPAPGRATRREVVGDVCAAAAHSSGRPVSVGPGDGVGAGVEPRGRGRRASRARAGSRRR